MGDIGCVKGQSMRSIDAVDAMIILHIFALKPLRVGFYRKGTWVWVLRSVVSRERRGKLSPLLGR